MRILSSIFAALTLVFCLTGLALAQSDDDDRGFITTFLEDSLGGEGRTVRIDGFEGAFSSRATIEKITISDDQGPWLTMSDIGLDWSRSALLRGRVEVTELSAAEVRLDRLPQSPPSDMPAPEAGGFSLPELPVSVNIDAVNITRILLGAPVLGEAAEMTLNASARLSGGDGSVQLNAARTDGQTGRFVVDAQFVSATKAVTLSLDLSEAEDGLVARTLDLPGRPALRLVVAGEGPLDDLATDITLETAGVERLTGQVRLQGEAPTETGAVARQFSADLSGDLAPLFAPQYATFFGDAVALNVEGTQSAEGALELTALDLRTGSVQLTGALALSADYWPQRVALQGLIETEGGGAVLLPTPDGDTSLQQARLRVVYDAAVSEDWTVTAAVRALTTSAVAADTLELTARGKLGDAQQGLAGLGGRLAFHVAGLDFDGSDVQQAVGDTLTGTLALTYSGDDALVIEDINIRGADYGLIGQLDIAGLSDGFKTQIDTTLTAQDLSRFSALAGTQLGGDAGLKITGTADLGGAFDLKFVGETGDLQVGIPQADAALQGRTTLDLEAVRDLDGLRVPRVVLRNGQLDLTAKADIATDASEAEFDLSFADSALIDPALKGPVRLSGTATQDAQGWSVDATALGPFNATTTLAGRVTGDAPALTFDLNLPDIKPIVPQYSGAARVTGTAAQDAQGWSVDTNFTGPYGLAGSVEGRATGSAPSLRFDVGLPNVQPLVPQFSGAARVKGTASQIEQGWTVDTNFTGPYGTSGTVEGRVTGETPSVRYGLNVPDVAPLGAQVSGSLAVDGTATQQGEAWRIDTNLTGLSGLSAQLQGTVGGAAGLNLSATGTAPLGLAGPFIRPRSLTGQAQFDLQMSGPAALSSLSGRVSTSGARLSAPTFRVALDDIAATVTLARGQAQLDISGAVSSGGRVTLRGPITLTGSMPADLTARLEAVRLVDPTLYQTTLNGQIRVAGPLGGGAQISGQIDVGETNVQVPSSGTTGFSIVPEITHVNAAPRVRATQNRAGFGPSDSSEAADGGGPSYGLNIVINAPSRIFVRGRGLDAELGGRLTLRGQTDNIISAGRFQLIRGRLDVLGKRFVLSEGSVDLQGSFQPFLRFVATTNTQAGSASVILEGPAAEPEVRFTAIPDAPQDEVLAQIFFGRDVSQLSAFQALQLASAVATLAGQGGEGIVSKLRRGFDLDDLDVTTDDQGNAGLRVGKYLTDNIYTDVTVGDADTAGVSINIDLTPSLTARGQVKSSGDSSIGIFYEKDY